MEQMFNSLVFWLTEFGGSLGSYVGNNPLNLLIVILIFVVAMRLFQFAADIGIKIFLVAGSGLLIFWIIQNGISTESFFGAAGNISDYFQNIQLPR